MADNGVPESVKNTAEDLQELGREVYKRADAARREVIKRLYDVADEIRAEAKDATGEARDNADQIAKNLEMTANKLNNRAVDQIEEAAGVAKDNLWQTVVVALVVGLVIGLLIGRD